MMVIVGLIVLFFIFWLLDPHIDYDKKNEQLIIWYGMWDDRKKIRIPWKSK